MTAGGLYTRPWAVGDVAHLGALCVRIVELSPDGLKARCIRAIGGLTRPWLTAEDVHPGSGAEVWIPLSRLVP